MRSSTVNGVCDERLLGRLEHILEATNIAIAILMFIFFVISCVMAVNDAPVRRTKRTKRVYGTPSTNPTAVVVEPVCAGV
jgi:ascorbate-specific PTS system EIIC-type component UlaA